MKGIIFYKKKLMKKSFVILKDVSDLCQSYQLSDLSQIDYFVIRIYKHDFKQLVLYLVTL